MKRSCLPTPIKRSGRLTPSVCMPPLTVINRIFGDASEMTQNLDEPRLVADDENATDLVVAEGRIAFENLSFQYTDGSDENIFTDFGLTIKPGERIGLVGRSGSGKTTLTRLLLRMEDIQEGRRRRWTRSGRRPKKPTRLNS